MYISCSLAELNLFELISHQAAILGFKTFVIGGFVRDKILNRPTKDVDIVCVGDGLLLAEAVANMMPGDVAVNYFKTYGTAQIKTAQWEIEFVGARKESYQENSRNPKVSAGTIQDDQNRRDFTINAMAISLNKENYGELVDPFNGIKHLQDKKLITPLEPDATFSDDPLRMMRAIRFASQLDFTIDTYTLGSIKENASRIKIITKERITDELNKIILSPKPSVGFYLLEAAGLLPIIFPELHAMKGVDGYGGKKHKDNFEHTLQVLDNVASVSNNLWLRWAAILHDIAKPLTKRFEPGHGWTFHGHEHLGSRLVPKIFTKLKLSLGAEMKYVQLLVLLHQRPISLTKLEITDSAIRRLLFDAGEYIEDLMLLCNADITSKDPSRVAKYKQNYVMVKERMEAVEASDQMRNWQPPITGTMVIETFNLKPSKIVGELKDAIREAILDGEIANNYEAAYALLLELGAARGLIVQE
jgi:poly(A) polymerase